MQLEGTKNSVYLDVLKCFGCLRTALRIITRVSVQNRASSLSFDCFCMLVVNKNRYNEDAKCLVHHN